MSSPPAPSANVHGILNLCKPIGVSSHAAVQRVRRAAGVRRAGHAGTLDPLATGVLIVCLGAATRLVVELQEAEKRYEAVVRLGVVTTTYDAEGEIVDRHDAQALRRRDVEGALDRFRGAIEQVPPMHSALKHHGRPLYALARDGIEVHRPARRVTVYEIRLIEWSPPDLRLSMTVSRGTYIRSLAHDLGQALGVGAHLAYLERTAVGSFRLTDSEPLDRVVTAFEEGWGDRLLHPLDVPLVGYPAVVLDADQESAVRTGQPVRIAASGAPARRLRAYGRDGYLVAVLVHHPASATWRPERVFPSFGASGEAA